MSGGSDWWSSLGETIEEVRDNLQSRYDNAVAQCSDYQDTKATLEQKKAALENYSEDLDDHIEDAEDIYAALESVPYNTSYDYCDGAYMEQLCSDLTTDDNQDYLYARSGAYIQTLNDLQQQVENDIDALGNSISYYSGRIRSLELYIAELRGLLRIL